MQFKSTRTDSAVVSFPEALLRGLAPDGGLYHPTTEPDLRALIRSFDATTPFAAIAAQMTHALFPEEFSAAEAQSLSERAFPFQPQLRRVTEEIALLELFHGPSCAFKDFGASFLAATMELYLSRRGDRAVILTATSGDTGSAVAQAFHDKENIEVVILYPSGRVSPLQEQQLTTLGGNVTALEVAGSFDDCQRLVKEAFVDPELRARVNLTSANSINIGRLIPQSFYYLYAFAQLRSAVYDELVYCVPSGNFGNLTAGVLAWRWGMPANAFIAATNANDVVPEYLRTGSFRPRPSIHTLANAMDVGNPSNFERLLRIFDAGNMPMNSMLSGFAVDDATIAATMRELHTRYGVLACPHTATGVYAAQQMLKGELSGTGVVVTLATAHPAKFVEVCEQAVGVAPQLPERLAKLMALPKRSVPVGTRLEELRQELLTRFG